MRPPAAAGERVVRESVWMWLLVGIGFPAAGAGLGWLLLAAADWVATWPWKPFGSLVEFVASRPEPQATIVAVAVGAAAGLALGVTAAADRLTVRVGRELVSLTRGFDTARAVPVRGVGCAYADGKELVLVGHEGDELARERSDLAVRKLRAAFVEQGLPWRDDDPYREAFRRWVPGLPGLPPGADALLSARGRALDRGDAGDAKALRAELARLGVVVREERKRQFWRPAGEPR